MILVTGAGGKTGRAVVRRFTLHGQPVRALVRREANISALLESGAREAIVADMLDPGSMRPAFEAITAIYHIPPNVHPREEEIGATAIQLSVQHGITHFVYHSVLRPYIHAMPHHLHKARVEERLFESGLPFTILQPAAYMQNTLPGLASARAEGIFTVPYPIDTPLGMVDLEEVAETAAIILKKTDHSGATYELSGAEILTPVQIAERMGQALGKPVQARELDIETWRKGAEEAGMSPYQVDTLIKVKPT